MLILSFYSVIPLQTHQNGKRKERKGKKKKREGKGKEKKREEKRKP